jgi:hypothetical protein
MGDGKATGTRRRRVAPGAESAAGPCAATSVGGPVAPSHGSAAGGAEAAGAP